MVTIRTMTLIHAPVERCFKLSISIDLHTMAAASMGEKAIDGVTSGLIRGGETVTWRGRHFGWRFKHESLISVWHPYTHFRNVMTFGALETFEHDHHFAAMNDGTRLRDEIRFAAPGTVGRLAESLLLKRHLTKYLLRRNAYIKRVAESDEWHRYLDGQPEVDMRVYLAEIAGASGGRLYAGS